MEPRVRSKPIMLVVLCASAIVFNGCYTSRQISNPTEGAGEELEIVTTSGRLFAFDSWTIDSLGTIRGVARITYSERTDQTDKTRASIDPQSSVNKDETEAYAAIPTNDIREIRTKQLDTGKTVILGAAAGITVYGIIYMVKVVRAYQEAGRASSPKVTDLTIGF